MKTHDRMLVGALAALVLVASPSAAQDFKVIVNPANAVAELPAEVLGKILLKEVTSFPSGGAATPVDLGKASPVRAAFSKRVVGRPLPVVEKYWQQQISSGKDEPPPIKSSDDEVVAFVKANPGAVGYVSSAANVAGVKVVEVK